MSPPILTVREHVAWSYANLGRADAALQDGAAKYRKIHHIIRNKLYHGLTSGTMKMQSLYSDERLKMTVPQACYYCASKRNLSVDHLIPKIQGDADESDNLIWACRSCNSSKQGRDMLSCMLSKHMFPSAMLLRRYIKIVARYCEDHDIMDLDLESTTRMNLPFDLSLLPYKYPPLSDLRLWVYPDANESRIEI